MSVKLIGNSSWNIAEVNASHQLSVVPETNVGTNPWNVGAIKFFSENDSGNITWSPYLSSPETDDDARLRMASDVILDTETFNYTAQNTGKHTYSTSTLTTTFNTSGLITNGGGVTTAWGTTFWSYAFFPIHWSAHLYTEVEASFDSATTSNLIIDFGMFLRGASTAYAPTDGTYFRLNSSGMFWVVNYNGTETTTSVFSSSFWGSAWTHTINKKYKFIISITERSVEFWIDDTLYGEIETPSGQWQAFMSASLPLSIRHAHTTTAGAVVRMTVSDYTISIGWPLVNRTLGEIGSAAYGSYQWLSGGTMGQLIAGTVTTGTLVKPTAAVPANTSLVANLPNSLGGRIYEQLSTGLAANTDAIFASYTVPAGTVSVPWRRLKINGIKLSGMVSTVVVGWPAFTEWYLAFGTTADSLATTEAATAKAPRRVMLPELTTNMTAAQAAWTLLVQPAYQVTFVNPIYVNPWERIQLVGNKTITTAITSWVLSFTYQFDYTWE